MRMQHAFGGALIDTSVTPVSPETPPDPAVTMVLAAFLAMMNKAYTTGREAQFQVILEICLEEINSYLDDKRIQEEL